MENLGQDPGFLKFIKEMLFNAFLLESFSKRIPGIPKDELFLLGLFYKMPETFKVIDLMGSEGLKDHLKSLGIDENTFLEEHLSYAEKNVSNFV